MKTLTFKYQIFLLILFCAIPFGIIAQDIEFVQHVVTTDFNDGFDVIAEDLNKDGYPDIIGCAQTTVGEVSWWKNFGNNVFEKIIIKEGFQGARSVRAKDMNGDDEIDLVSAAWQANTIIYFENDGDENFTEYVVDSDFAGAHTVDLKDLNDDGYIDILCSGFDYYGQEGEIAWWESDGMNPIGWTKHLISDRFKQSPFIFGEDMDDDEAIDVIACGELNDEILWWENNGTGNFINEYMVDSLFDAAHTVLARDVDSDGDMDILGAACISSKLAWYENDGTQQFIKHPLPAYGGALWLDAIDIDMDDHVDLFSAGMSVNKLHWWQNNGSEAFEKKDIDGGFTQGFSIVPVNMDNDNDVDFVAIGKASNTISWFENKLEDPWGYNHPECCVFDYENQRWLISNTGGISNPGYILEVDLDGNVQVFNAGMDDPYGMCIVENTLYVSNGEMGVFGLDLDTGAGEAFYPFSPQGSMDGQAYDNDGHLFVVDTYGKIYKIYLETNTVSLFVSGLTNWTQDIVFDAENNRLLAIAYAINAPIQAISLVDSTITNFPTSYSYYDGITMDQFSNVYLASHQSPGRIIKYFAGLEGEHTVISTGHNEPAGLFYNVVDNIIAVPNYGGSTVDFISMARIIHVPDDQPTIQDGINAALSGDTVLVAPGTYTENINFNGKNIIVASHFIIDKETDYIQNTVIDGSGSQYPDTASCVRFISGESNSAQLSGFTICCGTGSHWVDPQYPSWTWHSGGGVFIFNSSPTISYNIIKNNHVDEPLGADGASGGGLCTFGGNPLICNNNISDNSALYGAGVVIDYSGCEFRNNVVSWNSGGQSYGGGGIWAIGNGDFPIILENNTIANNEVLDNGLGGGMYLWSTEMTARNNIVYFNFQPTGDPIYLKDGSSLNISYSNVEGGYTGEGNIDEPPAYADFNYVLQQTSPCVDAGNPDPQYYDLENDNNPGNALWPSIGTLTNDMGVYGGPGSLFLPVSPVGNKERNNQKDDLGFNIDCYPNPMKNVLEIQYRLNQPCQIQIFISDILGAQVIELVNDFHQDGNFSLTWKGLDSEGLDTPPGIYFCNLITPEQKMIVKIIKPD